MAEIEDVISFTVKSSLSLVADSWTARIAGTTRIPGDPSPAPLSRAFLTRGLEDRVTLRSGLRNEFGDPIDAAHIPVGAGERN
jgi:hypothetical protein